MNPFSRGLRRQVLNATIIWVYRTTLTGLVLALGSLCLGADKPSENKPGSKVLLQNVWSAESLEQKMLSMSEAGGGVLVLPKHSSLTATVRSMTYKGRTSRHALLVPEDITLDL